MGGNSQIDRNDSIEISSESPQALPALCALRPIAATTVSTAAIHPAESAEKENTLSSDVLHENLPRNTFSSFMIGYLRDSPGLKCCEHAHVAAAMFGYVAYNLCQLGQLQHRKALAIL